MKITMAAMSLLVATSASAQIYEWIDAEGNRVFSDRKPAGVSLRVRGDEADRLSTYTPGAVPRPGAPQAEPPRAGSSDDGPARPGAGATDRDRERICNDYLARVDAIQERLRAGYDEPEGNRLRARRSALQAAYRRDCG